MKMWKHLAGIRISVAFLLGLLLLSGVRARCSSTGEDWDDQSLARVDGEAVTLEDLDAEILMMVDRIEKTDGLRLPAPDAVLKRLIQNRLLEQEGYRREESATSTIRDQVRDMIRHKSMIALVDSIAETVPEPDLSHLDSLLNQSTTIWRVSHILVEERPVAQALFDSLSGGAVFADLVARHSLDSTTVATEGDLGWAREDVYIPAFRDALAGLSPGEISEPVRTPNGWHLLMLADVRTETAGQSEEMRRNLVEQAKRKAQMARVRSYVASLREKYDVEVNEALLTSLDYASADPEVQEHLKTSSEVLAVVPTGRLTVRGLTRKLRFKHFHGLVGKPDAAEARDKMLDEWISETLLIHEASELGIDKDPDILRAAEVFERELHREATLELILNFPFQPDPSEVESYYAEHLDQVTPDPRVKVRAAIFETEEIANGFLRGIADGTAFGWLVERTSGVVDPDPMMLSGWVKPEVFGSSDAADLQARGSMGPLLFPEGWVVAKVTAVEQVEVPPLDECKSKVLQLMKSERARDVLEKAMNRLEAEAEVTVNPKAETMIAGRLEKWKASRISQPGDSQ